MTHIEDFAPLEMHPGKGAEGTIYICDVLAGLDKLLETRAGEIDMVYMDPPFLTGDSFAFNMAIGETDWVSGHRTQQIPSFTDTLTKDAYYALMEQVLIRCRDLLRDSGLIFVHTDFRTHPYLRVIMDRVFGQARFLNEIVWVYQGSGRPTKFFRRRHDVILFYSKTRNYEFHIDEIMTTRTSGSLSHLRRHSDPDGRTYRSITSNGRVYTYYEDDMVQPTDVWDDIAHLQQRDPERNGYDTQKPLALLTRIIKCASDKGSVVLDPFCGSCTTLEAAARLERNFIGIDVSPLIPIFAHRRLSEFQYTIENIQQEGTPSCKVTAQVGVGFYFINLESFDPGPHDFELANPMDMVDSWSAGYLESEQYTSYAQFCRSVRKPGLETHLLVPIFDGTPAVLITDCLGHTNLFKIDPCDMLI